MFQDIFAKYQLSFPKVNEVVFAAKYHWMKFSITLRANFFSARNKTLHILEDFALMLLVLFGLVLVIPIVDQSKSVPLTVIFPRLTVIFPHHPATKLLFRLIY